jgi:uncharacterized phage-associated protein
MIPYRKEKIQNAIVFFAREHRKKTRKPLYQTYLYKYLAFLDFISLREIGRPALELIYKAMQRGPVPIEIYKERADTSLYKFVENELGKIIVTNNKPDMDYFSSYEIKLMYRLIEIYATSWMTADDMSDASHEDIAAWRRTYYQNPNTTIDYILEFADDLLSKRENELTYPEEVYLTYRAIAS